MAKTPQTQHRNAQFAQCLNAAEMSPKSSASFLQAEEPRILTVSSYFKDVGFDVLGSSQDLKRLMLQSERISAI